MEEDQVFIYSNGMSTGGFWTFWEFQKRSSCFYNNNGTPKENPEIKEGIKLCPINDEERAKITEACLKDKETRVNLNKLDIHRIPQWGLIGMMSFALVELE